MKIADLENEAWWRRGRLQPLTEAGYNRVQMHATSQPFIMLSAARGGLPRDEIRKRSRQLIQQIRSQGLGAIQVEGHWEDDTGPVVEPSFFVPLTGKTAIKSSDELLAFGQKLAAAYQQQTILFGDTKFVYEVGETIEVLGPVADITTKEIGNIYSRIRNRDFKFPRPPEEENEQKAVKEYCVVGYRVPTGYASALGMAAAGLWPESKPLR